MNTPASNGAAVGPPIDVRIHFLGRAPSRAVARFAAERIGRALARFRTRVAAVRVRVRDVNADRGGEDQQCSLELHLVEGGRLHLTELAATPMQALQRLARRAKRLMQRRRGRRRERAAADRRSRNESPAAAPHPSR